MASSTIKDDSPWWAIIPIPRALDILVKNILGSDSVPFGPEQKVFTTPLKIRNQGMIVCCECGVINSDSLKQCKKCKQDLIYIRDEQ